jgi:DNA repair protein RadA/Sms
MLLAVLEKRVGFKLGAKDVFLNIAGGIKLTDPCIDLAVISAVLSSNLDIAIPTDVCFAAEVGLSGEIRPIARLDQRIAEAQRLGFKRIYISKYGQKGLQVPDGIKVELVTKVEELFRSLFGKG